MPGQKRRAWGALEDDIMRILWSHETPLSAREIVNSFSTHTPAYSTVVTALNRLAGKGLVVKSAESPRKTRFQAAHSAEGHVSSEMLSTLGEADDREAALMQFAGNLGSEDIDILQQALESSRQKKKR